MDRTRGIRVGIVVNRLPKMLQEITAEILAAESDIEVVTIETQDDPDLIAQAAAAGLDALVTAAEPAPAPVPAGLLFARPRMAVIAIEPDGRTSTLHRLQPIRRTTRRLTPAALIRGLREAVEALRESSA
jgi:hypothetical protein